MYNQTNISLTQPEAQKTESASANKTNCIVNLRDMVARVKNEPKPVFIYSGIKEHSIGIVFGPAKSGKTMYCENLAMSIASGQPDFLGLPINVTNRKVLIVSFEEHYTNRTFRNDAQAAKLTSLHGDGWMDNYLVVNENMPMYIRSKDDWRFLQQHIIKHNPGVVILDSVTRMCQGIEESTVAQAFMESLRHLGQSTQTTIIAIHHTHKMYGRAIDQDCIAGSRVVAQELDFMIGINKTPTGKRYVKEVNFRYSAAETDFVNEFTIDDNCWLNLVGQADEFKLLAVPDGRQDDSNKSKLLDFITEQKAKSVDGVAYSDIDKAFVSNKIMSKQTAFTCLGKLIQEGLLKKDGKGLYSLEHG